MPKLTPFPEALTPILSESELSSGKKVFTASFQELPGVVCEGDSHRDALSELFATIASLRERLDLPVVGVIGPSVASWRWTIFEGAREVLTAGGDGWLGEVDVTLPDGFKPIPA